MPVVLLPSLSSLKASFSRLTQYLLQETTTQSRADPDVHSFLNLAEVEAQLVGSDAARMVCLNEYAQRPPHRHPSPAGLLPALLLVNQKQAIQGKGQSNTLPSPRSRCEEAKSSGTSLTSVGFQSSWLRNN